MNRDFRGIQSQKEIFLAEKADELRAALRPLDPGLIAARSGAAFVEIGQGRGELRLPFWGAVHVISFPELLVYNPKGEALSAFLQALFFYHLVTADGTPVTETWTSFGDLPGGRTYNQAFQGYTGDEITRIFGLDLDKFKSACEKAGGETLPLGDAAYRFQCLPRMPVSIVYHLGDEDFPSACKILFDASATHYLTIDGCAIIGSMLAQRIIKTTTLHFIQPK